MSESPALAVEHLAVEYPPRRWRGAPARVIEDVSFEVARGETVALVGESGSGKTTIGRAVLGLVHATGGTIHVNGADITHLSAPRARRPLAADLQAIFQNPYGSLDPALTIGATLAEPLARGRCAAGEVAARIADLLLRVGMPADSAQRYPGPVQRRPAPADRDRPRRGTTPAADHLRRADERAGCHHAVGRAEPAHGAADLARVRLPVHHPRPRRGARVRGPHDRAREGNHRRDRTQRRRL